jgi:hypothetical protein
MSTARRFALVALYACAVAALTAATSHAQVGPTNPSGGTSLRQTTLEGQGSSSPAGILARDLSFQTGWQSWFGAFAGASYAPSVGRTGDWRSRLAVVRKLAGRR